MTKVSLCATCGKSLTEGPILPRELVELLHGVGAPGGFGLDAFNEVADHHPLYAREAFCFVREGVERAVRSLSQASRHVTATELLEALRLLALERYGSTTREKLRSWGITRCEDFGEIVFTLIEHGIFGKRPEDKKEDFAAGYDFASAFPTRSPNL